MSLQRGAVALCLAVALSVLLAGEGLAQRGIRVQIRDKAGQKVALYKASYALLIGISDYRGGWPKLPGVKSDMVAVKTALEAHDFNVTVVRDPNRAQMTQAFNDFINRYGQEQDNRLLFYYAGHGHTQKLAYGEKMGYLVPVDAPNPNKDISGFLAKSLDMQQIEVYAKRIQAKHALFLFDSCFSGSIFSLSRAVPENISYKTARPVRQFITAGSADETVPDISIFRRQFVAALNGEGDVDGDGYVTGTELGEFLQKNVVNYTKGAQHPQYGKIRNPLLDKGDFVFRLARARPPAVAKAPTQPRQERPRPPESRLEAAREAWGFVKDGDDPDELKAFVEQFPDSSFARTARFKIGILEKRRGKKLAAQQEERRRREGTKRDRLAEERRVREKADRNRLAEERRSRIAEQRRLDQDRRSRDEERRLADQRRRRDEERRRTALQNRRGSAWRDPVTGMQFAWVPGGSFRMGCVARDSECQDDEKKIRTVKLDGYWMGKYEVTQAQWKRVMGDNPSYNKKGGNYPVENVSWNLVQKFIRRLNRKSSVTFRLPSEAQWEYACRAGGKPLIFGTSDGRISSSRANYNSKYKGSRWVGSYPANGLGLHDMAGNLWEFVQDKYASYRLAGTTNPINEKTGKHRVVRDGDWGNSQKTQRCSDRKTSSMTNGYKFVGFRLMRVP